jgi:hypothetical protein
VTVEVATVDEVCKNEKIARIDFMKIDVEGAELAVLEGATSVIENHAPRLLLEIEDRHLGKYGLSSADVVWHLTAHGYRMYAWDRWRWAPASRVTTAARNYLFSVASDRHLNLAGLPGRPECRSSHG